MCSYTIPKAVTLIALPNPLRKPVNVLKIYHHAFKSLLYFQNMREMPINAIRCYLVDHSFGSKQCYFRHLQYLQGSTMIYRAIAQDNKDSIQYSMNSSA